MKPIHLLMALALGAFVLYAAIFLFTGLWLAKRRKGRSPFAKNEKLLRRPGQHLEGQLDKLDEDLLNKVMIGLGGPPLVCFLLLPGLLWVPRETAWWVLLLIVGAGLVSGIVRVLALRSNIKERHNRRLGLMGERYVADTLQPLTERGYSVFHDAPAEGGSGPFNLDHVVVGPSGVFVVETKARRKSAKNEAGEDHKIIFDGKSIRRPDGGLERDPDPIKQARDGAAWLRAWLKERLAAADLPVQALVTLPGWFVEAKGRGDVNVLNPKLLAYAIDGKPVLNAHQVSQIRAQLDSLCRTVAIEV